MNAASDIIGRLVDYVLNPAMLIVFSAGFFLFVYGLVQFLWRLDEGGDNAAGKQHMIWGIVGMFIMVSVWGIVSIIENTFEIGRAGDTSGSFENVSAPPIFQ